MENESYLLNDQTETNLRISVIIAKILAGFKRSTL